MAKEGYKGPRQLEISAVVRSLKHIESLISSAMQREHQEQVPHWPEGQVELLLELPDGHWFYEAFDRLNRTPQPEEILAPVPAPGLVRDVEEMSDEGDEGGDEEGMEEGLDGDGDYREHRRISSHSIQSTDTVYPLTVNEVVVPYANTSVACRIPSRQSRRRRGTSCTVARCQP